METGARRYGGLSAEERDQARRERLLASLHEMVGTAGYSATTVDGICAAAKVSTRDFYRAYRSKEDAFLDLYSGLVGHSLGAAKDVLASRSDGRLGDRIAAMTLAYLRPMLSDLRVARINFVESVGISSRVEECRLSYREALLQLIEQEGAAAVARGEAVDRDFRFAGLALIGAANAVVFDWAQQSDRSAHTVIEHSLSRLASTLVAG